MADRRADLLFHELLKRLLADEHALRRDFLDQALGGIDTDGRVRIVAPVTCGTSDLALAEPIAEEIGGDAEDVTRKRRRLRDGLIGRRSS